MNLAIRKTIFAEWILYYELFTFYFLGSLYRSSEIAKYVFLIFELVLFVLVIKSNKWSIKFNKLFIYTLIIFLFSVYALTAHNTLVNGLIAPLLLFTKLFVLEYVFETLDLRRIFNIFIVFSVINAVLLLIELLTKGMFNPFINFYTEAQLIEATNKKGLNIAVLRGGFEHPLVTSLMLTTTIPIIYLIKYFFVRYLLLLINLYLIIGTGKRSGILISFLLVAMIEFLLLIKSKKLKTVTQRLLIITLGGASIFLFLQKITIAGLSGIDYIIHRFLAILDKDSFSLVHRSTSLEKGVSIIFEEKNLFNMFFGSGFNFLPQYYQETNQSITNSGFLVIDNSYLSFLADYGVLFSGLFIFLIMYYFIQLSHRIYKENKIENLYYLIITFSMFISVLSSGIFFDVFNWYQTFFIIPFIICLLSILVNKNVREIG